MNTFCLHTPMSVYLHCLHAYMFICMHASMFVSLHAIMFVSLHAYMSVWSRVSLSYKPLHQFLFQERLTGKSRCPDIIFLFKVLRLS